MCSGLCTVPVPAATLIFAAVILRQTDTQMSTLEHICSACAIALTHTLSSWRKCYGKMSQVSIMAPTTLQISQQQTAV